jgi:hypothetical protein
MLKKTKIFLLFAAIVLVIIFAIVLITKSVKTTSPAHTVPVIPSSEATSSSILSQSSLNTATQAKALLLPKLPLEVPSFTTSNGFTTDIIISSYKDDTPDIVRIEVYGIDYLPNQNDPATNPNMVAYKESFQKAISLLKENNVDITQLHILTSNQQYIRDITEIWIKDLNLLP